MTNNVVIAQNQAWQDRAPLMNAFIQQAFNHPIKALEIGVWYGVGSTNIWLNHIKPGSTLQLVDVWKPYASDLDLNQGGDGAALWQKASEQSTDAFLSTFLNVKKFQNENADRNIKINMTRADSMAYLDSLNSDYFDFIYIDGDHKYDAVKSDIVAAKRMIKKDYGIICGDDLEFLPTKELVELAKLNKNSDVTHDGILFHAGVLLAVSEEFEKVNMRDCFWWIACINGKFEPAHLHLD